MSNQKMNSTIEVWFHRQTQEPPRAALVFAGWFSSGWCESADQHFRILAPDGICWHVIVFDGEIDGEEARRLVHVVFDGHVKMIDLNRENYARP